MLLASDARYPKVRLARHAMVFNCTSSEACTTCDGVILHFMLERSASRKRTGFDIQRMH